MCKRVYFVKKCSKVKNNVNFLHTNFLMIALSNKSENYVLIDKFFTVIALGYNSIEKQMRTPNVL